MDEDRYVSEFFEYDVLPRYQREHPNATKQELDAVRNAYSYPQSTTDSKEGTWTAQTSYPNNSPSITYKEKFPPRSTIVHENTHGYRHEVGKVNPSSVRGFDANERVLLESAYNLDTYPNINVVAEQGATNAELRYKYWRTLYTKLGRRPTLEELDNYINSLSYDELSGKESKINGYGQHSINQEQSEINQIQQLPGGKKRTDQMVERYQELQRRAKQQALIHVADNDQETDMTNLAKEGLKIRFTNKLHK